MISFFNCRYLNHHFLMLSSRKHIKQGNENLASDIREQNNLIKMAGSVLGTVSEPLVLILSRRMLHNLLSIMDNTSHPHHDPLVRKQSVFLLDHDRKSFLSTAAAEYDDSLYWETRLILSGNTQDSAHVIP